MSEPIDPADLRISHAERQHVLDLLQRALDLGMLDVEEYGERSGRAVQAVTRRDVNVLVADIAVLKNQGGPAPSDTVELRGDFSSVKRKGRWEVPRKLVLRRRMGSAELDFTEAHIVHPVVEIELDIGGGSVEMRLPEGASASIDGIEVTVGSIEDHRKNPPREGTPHFLITGRVRWGSMELKGPKRRLFG
ncbi:DUF1707 SHOCT-like domain-containing protein [Pseudonocardia sp. GCM10023141]|uniref:DUF1707 SHOCT-like domain-containing protein n=1 Tax=Pseudonocardia sp. GCM10023141 TaxID=3252653 RepID=UPI0036121691